MIIFGWGRQTIKNLGPTFQHPCNHCNNNDYWILTRVMTWFTLFFIPVFPYSIKYFLSCSICQYGLTLDNEQVEQIKPLAEVNQLFVNGEISEVEYKEKLNKLGSGSATQIESEVVEPRVLSGGSEGIGFCSECGAKVAEEVKFCGNCGMKVSED